MKVWCVCAYMEYEARDQLLGVFETKGGAEAAVAQLQARGLWSGDYHKDESVPLPDWLPQRAVNDGRIYAESVHIIEKDVL